MAIMGLRINGQGGGGGGGIDDLLAKAFFGDPEIAIKEARLRSDLEAQQYQNRHAQAAADYAAAQAAREQWDLSQRQGNLPTIQDFYAGLVEAPVPVETEVQQTLPDWQAPAPVENIDIGGEQVPDSALGRYGLGQLVAPPFQNAPNVEMPVAPVEDPGWNFTAPGGLATTVYSPQGPTESHIDPAQQAAYDREVAARRAEAALIIGGGGNAAQMAQGLGYGEGVIKGGSSDPAVRLEGNILTTGSHPPSSATGTSQDFEMTMKLRDKFAGTPEFEKWSVINTGYQNMVSALNSLNTMDQADPRRGPADMRLIYNYLKMLDPQTGVKESEYSGAREAGGAYASLWNLYDQVVSGAVLDQGTREAYLKQAFGMVDTANRDLQPLIDQYTSEAGRYGITPDRVVRERPTYEEPKGDALPGGVSEEQVARLRAANPGLSREDAVKAIVAKLARERAATKTGQ